MERFQVDDLRGILTYAVCNPFEHGMGVPPKIYENAINMRAKIQASNPNKSLMVSPVVLSPGVVW